MRDAARVIVRNERGDFLLVHTIKKGRNRWEFPGGKIDDGEHAFETAARECIEETGVTPFNLKLACCREIGIDEDHWRITYFYAASYKGTPKNMEPEKADDVKWVPADQIDSLPQIPRLLIDIARNYSRLGS